jgi:hypothetical protein
MKLLPKQNEANHSYAFMVLQYLLVLIGALVLAGLGVWLQHTLGNHSQVLSAQELSSQQQAAVAIAPQLKYDDEGFEMPIAFPSAATQAPPAQRDWLAEELPPQF